MTSEEWARLSTNPVLTYTAHAAPMQMVFYRRDRFPAEYRGDAFVAMHGSWNRGTPSGYEVVRIRFQKGTPARIEPFLTGFLTAAAGKPAAFGRPVGRGAGRRPARVRRRRRPDLPHRSRGRRDDGRAIRTGAARDGGRNFLFTRRGEWWRHRDGTFGDAGRCGDVGDRPHFKPARRYRRLTAGTASGSRPRCAGAMRRPTRNRSPC